MAKIKKIEIVDITEELEKDVYNFLVKSKKGRDYDDYTIHATDIYSFCPRRFVIAKELRYNPRVYSAMTASTSLTFKIGEAIEDIIVASINRVDKLFGNWKCLSCGEKYVSKNLSKCVVCNSKSIEYLGFNLTNNDKEFTITGNIDVVYHSSLTDKSYVLECKSIGNSNSNSMYSFDSLTSPILEHVYQVNTYLYLLGENRNELKGLTKFEYDYAYIIYVSKLHRNTPFKVFRIDRDKQIQKEIREIKSELSSWKISNKLPERRCVNRLTTLARNYCPPAIIDLCFSRSREHGLQ